MARALNVNKSRRKVLKVSAGPVKADQGVLTKHPIWPQDNK